MSAEIGSLTLEFTRLTQLTGDPKYYDAVARISNLFAQQQSHSNLPGLWPVFINPVFDDVSTGSVFSLGAMADSLYEYLPKTWALLGGRENLYREMYDKALAAAKEHLFYRPLNPWKPGDLMMSGERSVDDAGSTVFAAKSQHLACFVGGMVGLASRLFESPSDLVLARRLTDGCIWAYNSTATGIAPEIFTQAACDTSDGSDDCKWSEARWHATLSGTASFNSFPYGNGLHDGADDEDATESNIAQGKQIASDLRFPEGFLSIPDRKYQLRPEALESVFIMYRITGDKSLREQGWTMFEHILNATRTEVGFAGLSDVTDPLAAKRDRMESFWPAETLKYAWLLFVGEDVISLDEWVFNTEAHPFRLEEA